MMAARGNARSFRWQQSQWRSAPLQSCSTAVFTDAAHANAVNIIRMAGDAVANTFVGIEGLLAARIKLIVIYSIDAASSVGISLPDHSVVKRARAVYANSTLAYTLYANLR